MSARVIMVQGTTSNAGKSFLVTALCRIFARKGYSVAPFKSQNMALNSYVTALGGEIGRAQAVQAQAAGIPAHVDMNPILLKPDGNAQSQVIVSGNVRATMSARDYFSYRSSLKPEIQAAFYRLASTHDIVVVEGAGSPVEINLNHDDIVNMGLAHLIDAPVLLVGDIDRGGVFASLYGTVALLPQQDRELIKGLVINRFRGDPTLLGDGPAQISKLTGVPVLGCIPYMDAEIEGEDSLVEHRATADTARPIDIAVIDLPHLSNVTDFNPLLQYPQVGVRYVSHPQDLGTPAAVILPGTKRTLADLRWMYESHMAEALSTAHASGSIVVGICGGYQMLGQEISDPDGVEDGGSERGLSLLPICTTFAQSKQLTQVTGHISSDLPSELSSLAHSMFTGYEIHMGRTERIAGLPLSCIGETTKTSKTAMYEDKRTLHAADSSPMCSELARQKGRREQHVTEASPVRSKTLMHEDGCACGHAFGGYVHGIFEDDSFTRAFVQLLADRAGVVHVQHPQETYAVYRDRQYDVIADGVEQYLDMDAVWHIMEEGV